MKTVKKRSRVLVDYEGRVKNGEMFDTSKKETAKANKIFQEKREYSPMEVTVGETQLIKGFTAALIGMKENEEKEVTVDPGEGYGDPNPVMVVDVPKDKFKGITPKKEQLVVMEVNGQPRPARVREIMEDKIKLDFNHVLSGKTLVFKIKIIKIISS